MENQPNNLSGTTPAPDAVPEPTAPEEPVEGAIFSGSDTRVETENLPEITEVAQQAPMSSISPALRTESTVTGDLKLNGTSKKKKWPLVVLGVVVVAVIGVAAWLLGSRVFTNNRVKNVIGEMNLDYLFDETAPIPAEQNGQYGYLDPENGGWTITPQYLTASNFYGDYAAVSFSQANQQKIAIINRNGDTVVTQESGSVDAYYDIQNNIWVVGGNIYDSSMRKLNADGVTGNYIGNGYIISNTIIEKNIENSPKEVASSSDEASEEGSSSSTPGSTTDDNTSYTEVVSKIEDLKGNIRYDCQAFCVANTTNDGDGHVYAVVRNWGEPAKIVALPSGEVLYTASGTGRIRILQGTMFVEDTGDARKYLKIENNKVSIVNGEAEEPRATISNAGEYYVEECNGRSSILRSNGETIMKCDVLSYIELSEATYLMYQATFSKDPLFVERDDKLELVNLRKVETLQTFEPGEITVYDNSPFFYALSNNGSAKVCNLLKGVDKCVEIEDSNADIAGFGNYFTVTTGDKIKTYNANLEMIHE